MNKPPEVLLYKWFVHWWNSPEGQLCDGKEHGVHIETVMCLLEYPTLAPSVRRIIMAADELKVYKKLGFIGGRRVHAKH